MNDPMPQPLTPTRDAMIYIPGLGGNEPNQSIGMMARRIAAALDRQALSGEASFSINSVQDEEVSNTKMRMVTISRRDGQSTVPIIDLYGLEYMDLLKGEYARKSPFFQAMTILTTLVMNLGSLIGSLGRPSKTIPEKVQIFWGGLFFVFLALYMLLTLFTVAYTAWNALQSGVVVNGAVPNLNQTLGNLANPIATPIWLYWFQLGTLATGSTYLFSQFNIKDVLSMVAADLSSSINYLSVGERAGAVGGLFSALLEHIVEKGAVAGGVRYNEIHILAYSFGSIVAIDSLFPTELFSQRIHKMGTLVTIGCPFDMIRTYWPEYFSGRYGAPGIPRKWINFYNAADVLASNFWDDGHKGKPAVAVGIQLQGVIEPRIPESIPFRSTKTMKEYNFLAYLALIGFRMHSRYWEAEMTNDRNCFDPIVNAIYGGTDVLS